MGRIMTTKLYMKKHNKTGLKYLGKTEQDPYKYRGSGTRWLNHIRKHGNDVTTKVLKECLTKEEVKKWGKYYSELWDVVNNKSFANLQPEEGTGHAGPISKEHADKLHKGRRRSKNSPEHIAAFVRANTGRKNTQESKEKMKISALADPNRSENCRKAGLISAAKRSQEEKSRIGYLGAVARWGKK